MTLAQRKLFALKYFAQKPFRSERRLGKIVLHDDGTRGDRKAGDGIFSSSEAPAVLNGGYYEYTVGVDAVARMALQRSCFNRQIVVSKFATAVLDADAIKTNLEIKLATEELFFDRSIWNNLGGIPRVAVRTAVLFTPQVGGVSWLPGRAAEIDLDVKNGTVVVPFTDNWNGGTYIAVVEHSAEITPSVVVSVGGVRSKEMLLGDSTAYCLQKYTFPEVERNANQLHIEFNVPNVRTTNQGPFVKTVTKGNKVILSRKPIRSSTA